MNTPGNPPSALLEFDFSDKFRFLYSPETKAYHSRITGENPSSIDGQDPWIVGAVTEGYPVGYTICQETVLTYTPDNPKQLRRDYRKSYKQTVGNLQAVNSQIDTEVKDAGEKVLENTIKNMSERGVKLLGGFCVARAPGDSQVLTSVFYSEVLEASWARTLREAALIVDPDRDIPEDERTEENREYLNRLMNLEVVNETALRCAALVASLLPHPATISPKFDKGKKPFFPGYQS